MTTDPQATLEAAAKILESLDIDLGDLARHMDGETTTHTTVAEYLPTARAAASPACSEKYDYYWRLLSEGDSRCPPDPSQPPGPCYDRYLSVKLRHVVFSFCVHWCRAPGT